MIIIVVIKCIINIIIIKCYNYTLLLLTYRSLN